MPIVVLEQQEILWVVVSFLLSNGHRVRKHLWVSYAVEVGRWEMLEWASPS